MESNQLILFKAKDMKLKLKEAIEKGSGIEAVILCNFEGSPLA